MDDETILREANRFKILTRSLTGQEAAIVDQADRIRYLKKNRKSTVMREAYERAKSKLGGKGF